MQSSKKFAKWTGNRRIFDLLEKHGDRLTVVYDRPKAKHGFSKALSKYGMETNKVIRINYTSSMLVEVEFVGNL